MTQNRAQQGKRVKKQEKQGEGKELEGNLEEMSWISGMETPAQSDTSLQWEENNALLVNKWRKHLWSCGMSSEISFMGQELGFLLAHDAAFPVLQTPLLHSKATVICITFMTKVLKESCHHSCLSEIFTSHSLRGNLLLLLIGAAVLNLSSS